MQVPPEQNPAGPHEMPQPPQLLGSFAKSKQTSPHRPYGHCSCTQRPSLQYVPKPHALPHAPQ
jgi:hypothetical protein